jgi:hypothetical protein
MKSEAMVIQHKQSILQLAEAFSNVSAICYHRAVSFVKFYRHIRWYNTNSNLRFRPLPSIVKHYPNTIYPQIIEIIKAFAMTHYRKGLNYPQAMLNVEGIRFSVVAIQHVIEREGLGNSHDRWLVLKNLQTKTPIYLRNDQISFFVKQNLQFRERHIESCEQAEQFNHCVFLLEHFKCIGRVYLPSIVDTWCNYALGVLSVFKQTDENDAVIYYQLIYACFYY